MADNDPDRAAREFFGCKTLDGGVTDHSYDCADIPWKTPGEYACVRLTALLGRWRAQAVEECAKVADEEPVLEGDPPPEVLAAMYHAGPADNARASGIACRKSIAKRIRALSEGGGK